MYPGLGNVAPLICTLCIKQSPRDFFIEKFLRSLSSGGDISLCLWFFPIPCSFGTAYQYTRPVQRYQGQADATSQLHAVTMGHRVRPTAVRSYRRLQRQRPATDRGGRVWLDTDRGRNSGVFNGERAVLVDREVSYW